MSYSIQTVDIKDPEVEQQLINLLQDAFGTEKSVPHGHLYKNTVTAKASGQTIFLAAVEEGKIIGCNGYMATDFTIDGTTIPCYQSCWTATHPKHQGRKIFVNIMNEAKEVLKAKGAGFIYGLGNDNSHPILIKKLGFKEIPAIVTRIPNIPFVRNAYLNNTSALNLEELRSGSFIPVEEQILDLKKNTWGNDIIEIKEGSSLIWGRLARKPLKFGINLHYFYLGGMDLKDVGHFPLMMQKIFKKFSVQYVQVVSAETNKYNVLLKNWKSSRINGFIFYELNSGAVEHLNLYYGAIDVF
jgi:predicted N-acetyltransferase YhbS